VEEKHTGLLGQRWPRRWREAVEREENAMRAWIANVSRSERKRGRCEQRWAIAAVALLAALGIGMQPALADTTPINPAPGSELDLALPGGVLDQLYGLDNLERVDDFASVPNDQLWTTVGNAAVLAVAKFAGLNNTLGYFEGDTSPTFNSLFTCSGTCFEDCSASCSPSPAAFFTLNSTFRFGLSTSGGDTWSSLQGNNSDSPKDHMVTWRVVSSDAGHPDNPVGGFVIGWEDVPDASDDGDYNDLVVEVSGDIDLSLCGSFWVGGSDLCGDGIVSGSEECDPPDDVTCCACRFVDVTLTEGDDYFDLDAEGYTSGAVVVGLGGLDQIFGSENGDDVICGGPGNDTLVGQGGHDTLVGGAGHDTLLGKAGDDLLSGGPGRDQLLGAEGNDFLEGGEDADTVVGEEGDDILCGAGGADTVTGSAGSDYLDGSAGNDTLTGGVGDDVLVGGTGFDTLSAGEGNDIVLGGIDRDILLGGEGDDCLDAGSGSGELCKGGAGYDEYTPDCERLILVEEEVSTCN
jgi:Ca2+-binding RTX toxin-like protein